ncbi:MurR/RpiR family transcriptional regulator [Lacticaseibacillus nasuensis]|uniref:MurR/RpiR family transcriptional regulator n=1 Tax=Lacticaseibacillus nasuensis TaxID=944671 RepID=UPI00224667B8|nr:MurR/RpiR family transcriptional regulator [Lacticaseibacillus nasuensis]MCX2455148.1 MurR/RpiR family transcriptional regulator [Lacticaseibacillus nasuensis]
MAFSYLESLIRRKVVNSTETDRKITAYLLTTDSRVVNLTITQLADRCGVSETSIYKYVKKLGFSGYQDFKIRVASNLHRQTPHDNISAAVNITNQDAPITIAKKVIQSNIDLLSDFNDFLGADKLERTLALMYPAETFHFFGQGGSDVVAFDAYHKFLRTRYRCQYVADYHLQLTDATKVGTHDVAFLFSHSGATKETVRVAQVLKQAGCKLITLTGSPGSELAQLADISYILFTEEVAIGAEALTSRILYTTLTDILYLNLMYHDETANRQATDKIRAALRPSKEGTD